MENEIATATVNGEKAEKQQMSDKMRQSVSYGIINGVVRSIAAYLVSTDSDQDEVVKKLTSVVNAMIASGDLHSFDRDWFTKSVIRDIRTASSVANYNCCSSDYSLWYTCLTAMFDDDNIRSKWFNVQDGGYNPEEMEIISAYNEARSKYYKESSRFCSYISKTNRTVLNSILLKYGTIFQQVVPEWYKKILKCYGAEVSDT